MYCIFYKSVTRKEEIVGGKLRNICCVNVYVYSLLGDSPRRDTRLYCVFFIIYDLFLLKDEIV